MTPPARPTASLAPVCSGCQWVLISVWIRPLPVALPTAARSASALAARPPSIISAPSGPGIAITLHPAPWSKVTPPRSVVEIRGAACCALAEYGWSSEPPTAAALTWRKRRRDVRLKADTTTVMPPAAESPGSVGLVRVDGLMNSRLANWPDVFPDALRWTKDRPHRTSIQQCRPAQLAEQRRLLLV